MDSVIIHPHGNDFAVGFLRTRSSQIKRTTKTRRPGTRERALRIYVAQHGFKNPCQYPSR